MFVVASAPAPPVRAVATKRFALELTVELVLAVRYTSPALLSRTASFTLIAAKVSDSTLEMPTETPKPETLSIRTLSKAAISCLILLLRLSLSY